MYVERSLRGDTKKGKLIDELNLKHSVRLNRETTSKFFVGITKKIKFIIHPECLMPTIYFHIHLSRISNINQTWFRNCQEKWRYHLKNRYWITVSNIKYTKSYASLERTVKNNTVEGQVGLVMLLSCLNQNYTS